MFSLQNQFCNGFKLAADFSQEVIHKVSNIPSRRSSELVVRVVIRTGKGSAIFPEEIRNILSHLGVRVFLGQELSNKPLAAWYQPRQPRTVVLKEDLLAMNDTARRAGLNNFEVH